MIDYRFPLNPDWQVIVQALNKKMSLVKIGKECGLSDVSVLKLSNGTHMQPYYANGVNIMLLYLDVYGDVIPEINA